MNAVPSAASPLLSDLVPTCRAALVAAEDVLARAQAKLSRALAPGGRVDAALLDREQHAAHGFAWFATYVAALRATLGWAERPEVADSPSAAEKLILQIAFAEFVAQMLGGLPMSQGEMVRPADLGLGEDDLTTLARCAEKLRGGNSPAARRQLATLIADGDFGAVALGDETLLLVRDQFRRFAEDHREDAHRWHLKDELIPLEIIGQLAEMGVFGLTVPEEFGGAGLGKLAMCVVTEELSRGYIGLGSLGTRSEIAAELIRLGGTEEQKHYWLPKLASGEILPTAVFT
ncbi:MAG TPA: acyl-CoA dehydrogenase family protein, partial [Dongiaceae bacterium]|nr:acyl-CoA dehydrogenase family protein [Dongiaceae bacterium]